MSTPRFLIAKYAPDLRRMEPRNIGVIVWNEGTVVAKFLGDSGDSLRRLHLNSSRVYKEWIDFWRAEINKPKLRLSSHGDVDRTSPEFVDAILSTSRQNFMLVDGGFLLESLATSETENLAADLFREFVEEPSKQQAFDQFDSRRLRRDADSLLKQAELVKRKDFFEPFDWLCPIRETKLHLKFDYALHDGTPYSLLERVSLAKQQSVMSAFSMFDAMLQANPQRLTKDKCVAFVHASDEELEQSEMRESLKLVESTCTVINVCEASDAVERLRLLAP